jgi:hypothetical protein
MAKIILKREGEVIHRETQTFDPPAGRRRLDRPPRGRTCQARRDRARHYLSHLASIFTVARPMWKYPLDSQAMDDALVVLAERERCTAFAYAKYDWPSRWIAASIVECRREHGIAEQRTARAIDAVLMAGQYPSRRWPPRL